jgi:ABC-type polysaccharide/polyol phosphate export permease
MDNLLIISVFGFCFGVFGLGVCCIMLVYQDIQQSIKNKRGK